MTPRLRTSSCFAFDTETVDGEPFTIQFAGEGGATLERVERDTILHTFLRFLWMHGSERTTSVLFAHQLEFDLGVVFVNHVARLWKTRRADFTIPLGRGRYVHLQLICAGRPHARLSLAGRRWLILDTMSFFPMSLERACERLCLPVKKLSPPSYLGVRAPTSTEWIAFQEYALTDALAAWELGRFILRSHEEFGIPPTTSVADMASAIFRTRHLHRVVPNPEVVSDRQTTPTPVLRIPFCELTRGDNAVLEASLQTYHGGKSRLYVSPGVYDDVSVVDIVSAYPHAMASLPPLTAGRFTPVRDFDPAVAGVYNVQGRVRHTCPYGMFMTPSRRAKARSQFIQEGAFDTWVTGWELAAAWAEIELDSIEGYVWVPAEDAVNPFVSYVAEFFRLKRETAKTDPRRELYKLLLNSLYGKTVQRRPDPPHWVAGPLFNPFWGSQITGHCRARLHRLEHQYNALHSSTDSILTRATNIPQGSGLGELQVEAHGRLVVARSKLYVVLDGEGRITKQALHAFRGSAEQLLTILRTGTPTYTVRHMVRPRESLRTGHKPFRMEDRQLTVHLTLEVLDTLRAQLGQS